MVKLQTESSHAFKSAYIVLDEDDREVGRITQRHGRSFSGAWSAHCTLEGGRSCSWLTSRAKAVSFIETELLRLKEV